MNERELVEELSLRANVPATAARAVLGSLLELLRERRLRGEDLESLALSAADPFDDRNVERLIDRARRHPLGVEFLLNGYLGSVAAEFGAHAFTVEAARERLVREGRGVARSGVNA